jgi:hypothetical protein
MGLPTQAHHFGVEAVDHLGRDLLPSWSIEAPHWPADRERRAVPPGKPDVNPERYRARRAQQSSVRLGAVLPEEIQVADVLEFRERDCLAVDGRRDQVAILLALAEQNVLRNRAR